MLAPRARGPWFEPRCNFPLLTIHCLEIGVFVKHVLNNNKKHCGIYHNLKLAVDKEISAVAVRFTALVWLYL